MIAWIEGGRKRVFGYATGRGLWSSVLLRPHLPVTAAPSGPRNGPLTAPVLWAGLRAASTSSSPPSGRTPSVRRPGAVRGPSRGPSSPDAPWVRAPGTAPVLGPDSVRPPHRPLRPSGRTPSVRRPGAVRGPSRGPSNPDAPWLRASGGASRGTRWSVTSFVNPGLPSGRPEGQVRKTGGDLRPTSSPLPFLGPGFRPTSSPLPFLGPGFRPTSSSLPFLGPDFRPTSSPLPLLGPDFRPTSSSLPFLGPDFRPTSRSLPLLGPDFRPSSSSLPFLGPDLRPTSSSLPFSGARSKPNPRQVRK